LTTTQSITHGIVQKSPLVKPKLQLEAVAGIVSLELWRGEAPTTSPLISTYAFLPSPCAETTFYIHHINEFLNTHSFYRQTMDSVPPDQTFPAAVSAQTSRITRVRVLQHPLSIAVDEEKDLELTPHL
jgi:hypothetical protein